MKRLILLTALLLSFGASALQAQAPVKHFLLEEFTGSWCGWCTRGIYAIQQLEEKYPSQFIPIAFHNGDGMVISEGTTLQATVPGYPDAWFNRETQSDGTWNTDPTQWDAMISAELNNPVKADVQITNVTYNTSTRAVTATVSVKFLQAVSGDLRLNLYVTEDSLTGKGSGFDQTNYLTYLSGYETNPFYSLGHTVAGYNHMHVARAALGGAWGITGVIPATVTANSTYTKDFTYTLPATSNPDHIDLVASAFSYDASTKSNNEVFNANRVKLTNPSFVPISGLTITTDNKYLTASANGQTTQTLTIHNSNATDTKALVAIDKVFSVLATGWQATVSPQVATVPANGSLPVTLTFTSPANAAFVNVMVGVTPIAASGEAGASAGEMAKVNALSSATKYISYGIDSYVDGTKGMATTSYGPTYAAVGLADEILQAYPPTNYDVAIFPAVEFLDYTNLNGAPPPVAPIINAMLAAGKKVLLTSEYLGYFNFDENYQYYQNTGGNPTDELNSLMDKLGIQYQALTSHTNPQTGQITSSSPLKGFTGDVIGDGLTGTCKNGYYDVWDFSTTKGVPALYFDNDQTIIAGLHYDFGSSQRLVYLDFNLSDMGTTTAGNTLANKILTRSMDFLLNGTNAVEHGTNLATSLSNYPNPVSGETKINYSVSDRTPVSITVHDVLGREVASLVNSTVDAGSYTVNFDATNLPSGSYTYILNAGGKKIEQTMTVTK